MCPALNFGHLLRRIHIRQHGIAGWQQTTQCRSSCSTTQQQARKAANQRIAKGSKSPQDHENAHLATRSRIVTGVCREYASMHVGSMISNPFLLIVCHHHSNIQVDQVVTSGKSHHPVRRSTSPFSSFTLNMDNV